MDSDTGIFALAATKRAMDATALAQFVPGLLGAIEKVVKTDPTDGGYRAAVAHMDALIASGLETLAKPPAPPRNRVDDVLAMFQAAEHARFRRTKA